MTEWSEHPNEPKRARWLIVLILLLYVSLGVAYSLVVPPFEGYDEEAHFRYVDWLVNRRSLPVLTKGTFGIFHEAWQPPLYYALNAVMFSWTDTGDLSQLTIRRNPYWAYEIGQVGHDNKNMYLHGPWEAFPFRKTVLAIHAMRWLSVLIGAVTVGMTYALVSDIFPALPYLALGATALVAFNPQFLYVSGLVSNDGLVVALITVTVWILIRCVRVGWAMPSAVLLGLLTALAILTKLSGLILLPLIAIGAAFELWRTRDLKGILLHLLTVGGVIALASGWWFWRNWLLYGDWTSLAAMRDIIGRYDAPLSSGDIWTAVDNVFLSYWAFFGANNIPVAARIYRVLRLASGLALAGLFLALYRSRQRVELDTQAFQLMLVVAWAALAGLAVAYYIGGTPNANMGRNLFVAMPAIALLMLLGLLQWLPGRFRPVGAWLVSGAMACFAAACLVFYIGPAYARPPVLAAADMPSPEHPLDVRYDDQVRLRGYDIDRSAIRPGETLQVTLYWEALRPIQRDYSVFVQVFGRGRQNVGQRDTYPGLGNFPTSQWQPGTIIVDAIPVPIAADAQAPAALSVHAGLYELESLRRLSTYDADGKGIASAIGAVKLVPWQWPEVEAAQRVQVDFGDGIRLTGYELRRDASSHTYNLKLVWQPTARPSADYTVFIQVWDEDEQVAGFDGPPVGGDYPSSGWEAGEVIVDEHRLDWAGAGLEGEGSGRYRMLVGLYRLDTGERLPAFTTDGTPLSGYALELPLP